MHKKFNYIIHQKFSSNVKCFSLNTLKKLFINVIFGIALNIGFSVELIRF